MKNQQKITRVHLTVNQAENPAIIGIVSSDQDYKLSLKINKKLFFSLRNSDPVEIEGAKGNIDVFSRFLGESDDSENTYQLISNRTGKKFLLNKLKNIDYIMVITGHQDNKLAERLFASLKEIDSVSGVFKIEPDSISRDKNFGHIL